MPSFFKRHRKRQDGQFKNNNDAVLHTSLSDNIAYIKEKTGNSSGIIFRPLKLGKNSIIIIYIDGLVDMDTINQFIMESIMKDSANFELTAQTTFNEIYEKSVTLGNITSTDLWERLFLSLNSGETIIFVDGVAKAILADTKGGEKRSIQEPETQVAIRGARDGFTESIQTNITLVRRRIKNPNLWVESMKIGKQTNTDVSFMYLKGKVNDKVIEEVRRRLKKINIESILESGNVEQLIEDETWTTFPTLYHTERPDVIAGNILEGRVAIFVDGSPFVLLAPAVLVQFFQTVEDYNSRFDIATALRFLRILTFSISLVAPSIYIAATTYHQEMIPTQLLIVIAAQRENVPFPAFFEALLMEITFEILREAGVRMPKAVGSAISIVGALVIGQAAVQAGIVSPAMVIIVSITAIANFASPSFAIAISARLIRFIYMALAAVFGGFGIILGVLFLVIHLCSLRSFGVPYLTPFTPISFGNLGDTFIRVPIWKKRKQASLIMDDDLHGEYSEMPQPPKGRGMVNQDTEKGDS